MPPPDAVREEIRSALSESLSRFGVAGRISITGQSATLFEHGPAVAVDLGSLPLQWNRIDALEKQRRIAELARQLADARRSHSRNPQAPRSLSVVQRLTPFGILLLAVAALVAAYEGYQRLLDPAQPEASEVPAVPHAAPDGDENVDSYERGSDRAQRVCEATRSRVKRGAAVSPADVEGWVVELSVLKEAGAEPLSASPVLGRFVRQVPGEHRSELVWDAANSLAGATGPDTEVLVLDSSIPDAEAPAWSGLRLVFLGRYVHPFFEAKARADYIRLAAALAEALDSDYAALYARCAQGRTHHLGALFRGRDPGGATTALLYFMGTYADVPHLRDSVLLTDGELNRTVVLGRLGTVTAKLDKSRVAALLGPHGGMIAGPPEGPSTVTFPFRDSNRASRASRQAAREIGIGTDR